MAEKLFEVERDAEGVTLHFRTPKAGGVLSGEAKSHVLAAHKELLLGLRSFLDTVVESLDKAQESSQKKRTKIEIE